ncbi:MAG: hypothetical protein GXP41_04350 [Chloroflexi bacterium]|nr:hypothetical protein [Chloroflexota bacterium]
MPGLQRRRLTAMLGLAFCTFLVSIPPAPLVGLGPQRSVHSINPKMGVHTRLTDEVEQWKIKRTLEMVREMGASWVVEYFPWGYIEPQEGRYDWAHADMVVDHARRQGLTIVARLDFVPEWARPPDTTFRYLDESGYESYADFVYAFVEHFRGRVQFIIIWNEPNLSFEWGYRPPDPKAYTALLQMAYRRAKEANPDIQVLAAGLAPTLAPPGDPNGMNDLDYLQAMYDAGAAPYFDILAAHAYGWKFPADDPPAPDKINFRRVELLHAVMVRNGEPDKPIIISEGGWNDHPRWTKAVRPGVRIANSIAAYRLAAEWPWCMAIALWSFRTPWPTHSIRDYSTFVTPDFVPKSIYYEVQRYAEGKDDAGAPGK